MATIFARATAPGRAGIAVVRVSGPRAWGSVRHLTRRDLPPPRLLSRRKIWGSDGLIDDAAVIMFAAGASYTGEESAEFHLHGSEAVVRALLAELSELEGLRLADAGEFTRRALENDRIGLAEAEGLSALLEAESIAQHRQAMGLFGGALRAQCEDWRSRLTGALALAEATIDFADEDVPDALGSGLVDDLRLLAQEMAAQADGVAAAQKVARGFDVALVGPVNAGKSTLMNRLAGREAALTSDIAGTTRDVLEARVEIGGYLVTLLDTAGIRATTDPVERLGIERAVERANAADLRVFLADTVAGVRYCDGDLRVMPKADLSASRCAMSGGDRLAVSGLTGAGVEELRRKVADGLAHKVASAGLALTLRQENALRAAGAALESAAAMVEALGPAELISSEIRGAVLALDGLVGRVGTEDVLGAVFARFCIGK